MIVREDPPGFPELLSVLSADLQVLPDKPGESPEVTLKALWAMATGRPMSVEQARRWEPEPLDDVAMARLQELVQRRLQGTPLAHLTGRQDFMGLVLMSGPAALVPRRETELLARHGLLKAHDASDPTPLVLDICCGAGNVALAIAHNHPGARVFGSDLDPDAVALARSNAEFLGQLGTEFRVGDLLSPFDQPDMKGWTDVITCNPPYISSTRVGEMPEEISLHEPRLAFDGGALGVTVLRRLVRESPDWLRPGGWLVFEVGEGQGPGMARMLERNPVFHRAETVQDSQGHIRVVAAQRSD